MNVLFPLLVNRIEQEEMGMPQFIGGFDGVADLPRGIDYPAVYYWVDRSLGNSITLSLNTPMLERWCVEEAEKAGLDVTQGVVRQAIEIYHQASMNAFQEAVAKTTG